MTAETEKQMEEFKEYYVNEGLHNGHLQTEINFALWEEFQNKSSDEHLSIGIRSVISDLVLEDILDQYKDKYGEDTLDDNTRWELSDFADEIVSEYLDLKIQFPDRKVA